MNKHVIAIIMVVFCVAACDSRPINVHSYNNSSRPEFDFPKKTVIYTFEVSEFHNNEKNKSKIVWSVYSIKKSKDNDSTERIVYGVVSGGFAEYIHPDQLDIDREYIATATYGDSTVHSCRFSFVKNDNVIMVKQIDTMAIGGRLKF